MTTTARPGQAGEPGRDRPASHRRSTGAAGRGSAFDRPTQHPADQSVRADSPDEVVELVAPQRRADSQPSAGAGGGREAGVLAGALALRRWWFPADPYARVALFRTIIYLFVIFDIRRL